MHSDQEDKVIVRRETKIRYWKELKQPDGTMTDFYRCDRCGKVGRLSLFAGMDYCPKCGRLILDVISTDREEEVME